MPLDSQLVHVKLTGGLEQHTDRHHLQPGKMQGLINGRFTKEGSIRKRQGYTALSSTIGALPLNSGVGRLISYKNELLVTDGNKLGSYSPGSNTFIYKDKVPEMLATRAPIAGIIGSGANGSVGALFCPDTATNGAFTITAWSTAPYDITGDIVVTVTDAVTGAEIVSSKFITTTGGYTNPRVCIIGSSAQNGVLLLCYRDIGAGTNIYGTFFNPVTGLFNAPTTVVNDRKTGSPGSAFDISSMPGSASDFILAYDTNVASPSVVVKRMNAAWAVFATSPLLTSSTLGPTNTQSMSVRGIVGEFVNIVYTRSLPGPSYYVTSATLNPVTLAGVTGVDVQISTTEPTSMVGVERISATRNAVTFTSQTVNGGFVTKACVIDNFGTVITPLRRAYWTQLASKPIVVGPRVYSWCYVGGANVGNISGGQSYSMMLLDHLIDDVGGSARPVCTVAPRVSQPEDPRLGLTQPCSAILTSAGYTTVVKLKTSNAGNSSLIAVSAQPAAAGSWGPAQLGENLHLSGGVPSYYDGSRLGEIGFAYYPESITFPSYPAGGSLTVGVQYSYVAVFENTDDHGQVHRGIPSPPVAAAVIAGSNRTVRLQTAALGITNRQSVVAGGYYPPTQCTYYRNTQLSPNSYYRLASVPMFPSLEMVSVFDDTLADSSINTGPQLYTSGGVVSNVMPPSMNSMVVYRNRIWGIGDDTKTLWYSKQFSEGEAVSFADEFTLILERPGATSLAVLDGTLVAFASDRIYTITGDGPADTTAGNDISSPQRVSTDFGCVEPRSILSSPDGIYFQSAVGIYLLGRDLNVTYRGMDVEDTFTLNPTITSAIIHPYDSHYVFTGVNPTSGIRMVQDSISDQWGTDELFAPGAAAARILSSVVLGGTVYLLRDNGTVYVESINGWLDAGAFIPVTLEFAAIKVADIEGFQRVWSIGMVGDRLSPHTVTMSLASDDSAVFNQVHTFSDSLIDSKPLEKVRLHVRKQLCSTLRVKIATSAPTVGAVGTGRGMSHAGLVFDVGVLQGPTRIAPPAVG